MGFLRALFAIVLVTFVMFSFHEAVHVAICGYYGGESETIYFIGVLPHGVYCTGVENREIMMELHSWNEIISYNLMGVMFILMTKWIYNEEKEDFEKWQKKQKNQK